MTEQPQSQLKGEYGNICLLMLLYTMQGIPMGLARILPPMLREAHASDADLAMFSLQSWPFALKLIWAPLVDALYIKSLGHRKTWMVPAQLAIGAAMLYLSTEVDVLVAGKDMLSLTSLCFAMNFLCATQDIAVDGWALTMLRDENAAWQATTNATGQTFGKAIGFTLVTKLIQHDMITLSRAMQISGFFFIVTTSLVALLKAERPPKEEPESITRTYGRLLAILRLKPVQWTIVLLLTWKFAFAQFLNDSYTLKFIDYGVPKELINDMGSILMPLQLCMPMLVAPWTTSTKPLTLALRFYPVRIALIAAAAGLTLYTPDSVSWAGTPGFCMMLFVLVVLSNIADEIHFDSQMAFFSKIADHSMAGTYLTLLNTFGNYGEKLPATSVLFLSNYLTSPGMKVGMRSFRDDGHYIMAAVCCIVGAVWMVFGIPLARTLQEYDLREWTVQKGKVE